MPTCVIWFLDFNLLAHAFWGINELWAPDQLRIVSDAFIMFGIPIRRSFKPSRMAVEKDKLRAEFVQIVVNERPASQRRFFFAVK